MYSSKCVRNELYDIVFVRSIYFLIVAIRLIDRIQNISGFFVCLFLQIQPLSLCNDYCSLGHFKAKKEDQPFCCYDCFPCPAEKNSNQEGKKCGIEIFFF